MLTTEIITEYNPRMLSMNIKDIPDGLMENFHRWCRFHGFTLREGVIHFMEIAAKELQELERHHKKTFPDQFPDKKKPGD